MTANIISNLTLTDLEKISEGTTVTTGALALSVALLMEKGIRLCQLVDENNPQTTTIEQNDQNAFDQAPSPSEGQERPVNGTVDNTVVSQTPEHREW